MGKTFKIAVIPGDGIGCEVVPAALTVLEQLGKRFQVGFDFRNYDWGSDYYFEHGRMMPENALELLRSADAILLGAVGHPKLQDNVTLNGLINGDAFGVSVDDPTGGTVNVNQNLLIQSANGVGVYVGLVALGATVHVDRNVLISKTQNEGEAEATRIRSVADSKSLEMLANANAEATRIKGEGVAEAAQSFAVFQREPDLARFLLDLDTIELSLKSRATLIFDQRTQPFNLLQGYNPTNMAHQK